MVDFPALATCERFPEGQQFHAATFNLAIFSGGYQQTSLAADPIFRNLKRALTRQNPCTEESLRSTTSEYQAKFRQI